MSSILSKIHSKQVGFVLVTTAILLFSNFIFTLILASFVAVMEPDKIRPLEYFLTLWESFSFYYYLHVPATILLTVGMYG